MPVDRSFGTYRDRMFRGGMLVAWLPMWFPQGSRHYCWFFMMSRLGLIPKGPIVHGTQGLAIGLSLGMFKAICRSVIMESTVGYGIASIVKLA